MRSTHRMNTPFVLARRYGPKDVREYLYWVLEESQNFFRATQTPTTTLPLTHFWSNFASKRVSHVKNDQSGALEATKSFESIVGRSNLFLSKAYDLRILANTYSACHNPTKHFLKPIQVPRATFKISNFEYFCFKSGVEPVWSLKNRP